MSTFRKLASDIRRKKLAKSYDPDDKGPFYREEPEYGDPEQEYEKEMAERAERDKKKAAHPTLNPNTGKDYTYQEIYDAAFSAMAKGMAGDSELVTNPEKNKMFLQFVAQMAAQKYMQLFGKEPEQQTQV